MPVRLNKLPRGRWELTTGDNEPFLCRAAELQNSSFSSPEYMGGIWGKLVEGNINTVLGAIGWEDIEPEEGVFEFGLVDALLEGSRTHSLKVVILWFGSHKNGHMNYAPSWVKTNPNRFPRCETDPSGSGLITNDWLSVFSPESAVADGKALAALMMHLRAVDAGYDTVLMIQVENEPGILGDTRDRSKLAQNAYNANVPAEMLDMLKQNFSTLNRFISASFPQLRSGLTRNRSWPETFGTGPEADELFMAYHYALYIDRVTAMAKDVYPLPMYTNAALRSTRHTILDGTGGGSKPGIYPCGGPVETVIDIYQLFAPHLDLLSPDIYFADYETMCQEYTHRDRPLFIPEQRRDDVGAIRTWLALGQYGSIGAAPFGIDTMELDGSHFQHHYELVKQIEHPLLEARRAGNDIVGFFFDEDDRERTDPTKPIVKVMGSWELSITRQGVYGKIVSAYGLIIRTSSDTFLLVGEGYQVTFKATVSHRMTGILYMHEKQLDQQTGVMITRRKFNGDETHCGKQAVMPSKNPDNGWYPIPTNIPSGTRIAECRVYRI